MSYGQPQRQYPAGSNEEEGYGQPEGQYYYPPTLQNSAQQQVPQPPAYQHDPYANLQYSAYTQSMQFPYDPHYPGGVSETHLSVLPDPNQATPSGQSQYGHPAGGGASDVWPTQTQDNQPLPTQSSYWPQYAPDPNMAQQYSYGSQQYGDTLPAPAQATKYFPLELGSGYDQPPDMSALKPVTQYQSPPSTQQASFFGPPDHLHPSLHQGRYPVPAYNPLEAGRISNIAAQPSFSGPPARFLDDTYMSYDPYTSGIAPQHTGELSHSSPHDLSAGRDSAPMPATSLPPDDSDDEDQLFRPLKIPTATIATAPRPQLEKYHDDIVLKMRHTRAEWRKGRGGQSGTLNDDELREVVRIYLDENLPIDVRDHEVKAIRHTAGAQNTFVKAARGRTVRRGKKSG